MLLRHIDGFLRQIRSSYIAQKQRIATKQTVRIARRVFQQIASAFHGMSGCMQHLNGDITHGKHLSVFSNDALKFSIGSRTVNDRCTGFLAQIQMSAHKIGMKMGFKNVFQFHTIFGQSIHIGLYFAQGINDHRFSLTVDVIGTLRQTSGVDLLYIHCIICCLDLFYSNSVSLRCSHTV